MECNKTIPCVGEPTVPPTTPSLIRSLICLYCVPSRAYKGGGRRGNRRFPYNIENIGANEVSVDIRILEN